MLRQLETNQMIIATRLLEFEKENALEIRHRLYNGLKCPASDVERTNQTIFQELNKALQEEDSEKLTEKNIWSTFNILALKKLKGIRKTMKQNFNLTEKEFEQLKFNLKNGDETFFEHIFLSHFEDCTKFLSRKFKIEHHIAYDSTMETLLLFRKKLIQNKINYGNIRFLFTQMASQQYLKSLETKKKLESAKKENFVIKSDEIKLISKEEIAILVKSLDKLGGNCKSILKSFYYENISLKDISEYLSLPAARIRKQKERCLYKLKTLFKQHSN